MTPKGPMRCKDTRVNSDKPEPISFACAAETKTHETAFRDKLT